ncbi:MAG: ABC transporter permease [Chloroflexota bacterium]
MKTLRQIWFFILKDLRLFVTDRIALFFFILFPFLFIILFNFLLSGATAQDERLELHLVTREEGSSLSRQIIMDLETMDDAKLEPGEVKIIWEKDYDKALRALQDDRISGLLVFPEDFTDGILVGYGSELIVMTNPEATETRAALKGFADAISRSFGLQQAAKNSMNGLRIEQSLANSGNPPEGSQLAATQGGVLIKESLVRFQVEKISEVKTVNPANYVIPGYLVMFVFLAANAYAEAVVRERQNHTLERLIACSVTKEAILGGIFSGSVAKGLVQIMIFWGAGITIFKIDMGASPGGVILLSVLTIIMSAAFSLMLATLAKTQRGAASLAILTSLALAPLGGCWWPLFVTPKWMQDLAKITPHGWATTGFNKLMVFGGDFSAAVPEMVALAVFTAIFLIAAIIRFRTGND